MSIKILGRPLVVETPARVAKGKDGDVEVERELRVFVTYQRPTPGGDETLSCGCPRVVTSSRLMVWHLPDCVELERA